MFSVFLAVMTAFRLATSFLVANVSGGGELPNNWDILTTEDGVRQEDGTIRWWRLGSCVEYLCLSGGPADWDHVDLDGCANYTTTIYEDETGCVPGQPVITPPVVVQPTPESAEAGCTCDCENNDPLTEEEEQDGNGGNDSDDVDEVEDDWNYRRNAPVLNWVFEGVVGASVSSNNGYFLGFGLGLRMEYKQLYILSRFLGGAFTAIRGSEFPPETNGNWPGAAFDFNIGIRWGEMFSTFLGYQTFVDFGAIGNQTVATGIIGPGLRSWDAAGVLGIDFHLGDYFVEIAGGPAQSQFCQRKADMSVVFGLRLGISF